MLKLCDVLRVMEHLRPCFTLNCILRISSISLQKDSKVVSAGKLTAQLLAHKHCVKIIPKI